MGDVPDISTAEPSEQAERLQTAARAAARGDREAFAVLMTATQPRLLRLAGRLMNNPEEGRDVTQEVFMALWKVLPRLDLERPILPYLYRATVNKAARHLKKRPPFIALDGLSELAAVSAEMAMTGHQMRRAFTRLSRTERLVIALVSFEGYRAAEVAALTGRSPATVRQLLMRGRRKLAQWVMGNG